MRPGGLKRSNGITITKMLPQDLRVPPNRTAPAGGFLGIGRQIARYVLMTVVLGVAGAIPAILPAWAAFATLSGLRTLHCAPRSFIGAIPAAGDPVLDSIIFLAIDSTFVFFVVGWIMLNKDLPTLADKFYVQLGRACSIGAIGLAVFANAQGQQTCISEGGIYFRPTLGRERHFPWQDLRGVKLHCTFGRYASKGLTLIVNDGTNIWLNVDDFRATTQQQKQFWQLVYRNGTVVTFDQFNKETAPDPGCPALFPGLVIPG